MIESSVSWRWVFWMMMLFAGVCTVIAIVLLPETYAPVILLAKKKKLSKEDPVGSKDLYSEYEKQDWSTKAIINRTLLRPFHMLVLEPILLLITIYFSIVYGLLFARKRSYFFPSFAFHISKLFAKQNIFQCLKLFQSFLWKDAASQLAKRASCSSVLE